MAIVDAFLYDGEAELLELRLHELANVVDAVVLVDSHETFTGRSKVPEWFRQRRERRFQPFLERIHFHYPPRRGDFASPWEREAFQRNQITIPLARLGLAGSDLVLISDVDEVPRAEAVVTARQLLESGSCGRRAIPFEQTHFYFHPRCLNLTRWFGTRAVRYEDLGEPEEHRTKGRIPDEGTYLPAAGWHFSYFMTPERIQRKVRSYSHTEHNRVRYTERDNLVAAIRDCRSPYPNDGQRFATITPHDLPAFMLAHPERYGVYAAVCG